MNKKVNILSVFGTRPEAIKMAPLIRLGKTNDHFNMQVCVTAQHRQMLDQVLQIFMIEPDYDLNIMQENQGLAQLTALLLNKLDSIYHINQPDLILVQGDTTSAFIGALMAFYHKIPVGHIEAGLRSHDMTKPWPEEMNRRLISHLANLHFAPTQMASDQLLKEGIHPDNIFITGNTGIDALFHTVHLLNTNSMLLNQYQQKFSYLNQQKRLILVTGHRRESFGQSLESICQALAILAQRKDIEIVYPLHLNPNVYEPIKRYLSQCKNIFLIEPQDYIAMVYLLQNCYFVLTDSGGIQEEAPALAKPLLVMRNITERPEGIAAGNAKLTGVDTAKIVELASLLLDDTHTYQQMKITHNLYGDGQAATRIMTILETRMMKGLLTIREAVAR